MYKNEYAHDSWKREEHEAVRNGVGWYFFTHRLIEVEGDDAAAFLGKLCVNTVESSSIGRAKYTAILNEDGTYFDDAVVFRMAENRYWVSTLYAPRLLDWMWEHEHGFDVDSDEITDEWDMYSVQGPKSTALMEAVVEEPVEGMKMFEIRDNKIRGIEVKVARSGFTGERWGYEIYVSPDDDEAVEQALREAGEPIGAKEIREFQVMTLTLATEAGFCLMSDLRWLNPLEVDPNTKIDWEKDFIGKDALRATLDLPQQTHALVGFEVDNVDAHIETANKGGVGQAIMKDGHEVGRVTKYTYSFTQDKPIGFARIDTDKAAVGDVVSIRGNAAVLVERRWI